MRRKHGKDGGVVRRKQREAASSVGEQKSVLASRLRALFDNIPFVDEHGRKRRYPAPHVAETISQDPRHEVTVHRNTIDALRNGRQTNPHHHTLWALAQFFEERRTDDVWPQPVTVAYLLGEDAEQVGDEEADVRRALEDHDVRSVAMRLANADPETRRTVLDILDVVQRRRSSNGPDDSR